MPAPRARAIPETRPAATACATATRAATRHRTVLAFLRDWSVDLERPEDLAKLRAHLQCCNADLTVLAETGVWWFDDDAMFSDRACGEIARTALLLGAHTRNDTLFVIDGSQITRYPLVQRGALAPVLAEALTPRPENV